MSLKTYVQVYKRKSKPSGGDWVQLDAIPSGCCDGCEEGGFITPLYPTGLTEELFDEIDDAPAGPQTVNLTSLTTTFYSGDTWPIQTIILPNATKVGHVKRIVIKGVGPGANIIVPGGIEYEPDSTNFSGSASANRFEVIWGCNGRWVLEDYVEDIQTSG